MKVLQMNKLYVVNVEWWRESHVILWHYLFTVSWPSLMPNVEDNILINWDPLMKINKTSRHVTSLNRLSSLTCFEVEKWQTLGTRLKVMRLFSWCHHLSLQLSFLFPNASYGRFHDLAFQLAGVVLRRVYLYFTNNRRFGPQSKFISKFR